MAMLKLMPLRKSSWRACGHHIMLHMGHEQQTCFAISGAAMIDCQALSVNSFCVMRLPSPCCADTLNPLECLRRQPNHTQT